MATGAVDPALEAARGFLLGLPDLDLDRYTIVGNYLRYDEHTRSRLKDLRQAVVATFAAKDPAPRNFLLWGAPGSGKTYLVQQVAAALGHGVSYREINLARVDETAFRAELAGIEAAAAPVLCLIDEVDAKPEAAWPYEALLPYLEPADARPHRVCFCLAGSGGRDLAELEARMAARPKGTDLLSRVAADHRYVVPSLGVGDKVLVAAMQLELSARAEGRALREIERLALFYIAVQPELGSARQLRSLAAHSAQRIPVGDDRLRYDHLFAAGDAENKRFWESVGGRREGLADAFVHVGGARAGETGVPAPAVPAGGGPGAVDAATRLVVLPFANISPDPADEYFADGMTEELIERLSHVAGLRVIARTTAMHYKGSRETALEIGRSLQVGNVLECSVRKAGARIRITAQLIDTRTEEHLWAERYDGQLDDIFRVQDEIAGRIARSLAERLAPQTDHPAPVFVPGAPDTTDLEAYTLFLHGQKLLGDRNSATTIRRALGLFEEAVARDPGFARARVGIAEALLWLGTDGAMPVRESIDRALAETHRALAENDRLAEAHSALASILIGEDRPLEAVRESRRALELNPNLSDPYRWLAQWRAGEGKPEEAIRFLEEAQRINPLDVNIVTFLGRMYFYAGHWDQAFAHWDRTRHLAPYRTSAHETELHIARREIDQAETGVRELERLRPDSLYTKTYRGMLEALKGNPEGARRSLAELEGPAVEGRVPAFFAGHVHFALGEDDAYLAGLERSLAQHQFPLLEVLYSPLFVRLRHDPRVEELVRRQRALSEASR